MFDRNMGAALDRHITGNYGEDQFRESDALVEGLGTIVSKAVAHREYDGHAPWWDEVVEEIVNALVEAGVTLDRPEVEASELLEPEGDLNPDCGCGHPKSMHSLTIPGLCTGTGADLDPMYGRPADEACVCVEFEAMA